MKKLFIVGTVFILALVGIFFWPQEQGEEVDRSLDDIFDINQMTVKQKNDFLDFCSAFPQIDPYRLSPADKVFLKKEFDAFAFALQASN